MLWPGARLSATTRCFIETVVVVVVVTFFNHNFANCKATLILEIKNLRNKLQYKPKLIELISGTEANIGLPYTVLYSIPIRAKKSFDSIRFSLINLPLVHSYLNSKLGVIIIVCIA